MISFSLGGRGDKSLITVFVSGVYSARDGVALSRQDGSVELEVGRSFKKSKVSWNFRT